MIAAVSPAVARPTAHFGTPKAPFTASAMELDCTELKTRPKAMISAMAKIAPSQGKPSPREM
ncbi:hypothetical protein PAYE108092_18250 [Paracoccus yeei]